MLREQYSKRRLLVGVDRLDYSKGLPRRFRAFRELLENYPGESQQRHLDPDRLAHARKRRCVCRPAA